MKYNICKNISVLEVGGGIIDCLFCICLTSIL